MDDNLTINRFFDNSTLTDVAMDIEQFLSEVALIYPYKNWIKGEIVEGPVVKKYWISIKLKYDYELMPDPEGGKVLNDFGVEVLFTKTKQKVPVKVKTPTDLDTNKKAKVIEKDIWLVSLKIPKSLIINTYDPDLDDEENDGQDAKEQGIQSDDMTDNNNDMMSDAESPEMQG